MQQRDLLVQDLGEHVDADGEARDAGFGLRLVLLLHHAYLLLLALDRAGELDIFLREGLVASLVQHDLRKDLIGEGTAHDEGGVAGRAAQVDETALGEQDDVAAVGHEEAVDLRLDADLLLGALLEPGDVDLDVEVTDVADDGVLAHLLEVLAHDDVAAAGGGDEDLRDGRGLFHGDDFVAGHGGLQGVDRIDFGDQDARAHAVQRLCASLAHVTKSRNDGDLARDHDVRGPLDAVDQALAAAVQVVELALRDGVVDVDRRSKQAVVLALVLQHLVQMMHPRGRLLAHAVAALQHLRVLGVHEGREIAAIVEDEVERLARREGLELLLQAPVVFLLRLALPREDGGAAGCDGGCGVVLGGEDVARGPGDLGTQRCEGLDQDGGLDGWGRER